MKRTIIALLLATAVFAPSVVSAAWITDIRSSAYDKDDPFDMALDINYELGQKNTWILREYFNQTGNIEMINALKFTEWNHMMRLNLAIGVYKDLELTLQLPITISQQATLGFHPGIPGGAEYQTLQQINVDASAKSYGSDSAANKASTLFDMPGNGWKGPSRSGVGDFGVGFRWSPIHNTRHHHYPSWVLGFLFRIPTAPVRKADNTAVGEGLFQVEMNTAISRRVTRHFEPYFDLHGKLKVATGKSLFDIPDGGDQTMSYTQPGNELGLKLGAEFKAWEVAKEEKYFAFDVGAGLDFVFRGREYSELFEILGASPCSPVDGCQLTSYYREVAALQNGYEETYKKSLAQAESDHPDKTSNDYKQAASAAKDVYDQKRAALAAGTAADAKKVGRSDGITDVEQYGVYSFWLGFNLQPVKYFALGARFMGQVVHPHFLTFADAGKDLDGDGNVEYKYSTGSNNGGPNEYNPKYIEEIDKIGHRFQAGAVFNWSLMFTISGKY